ncbi:putative AMP deaminase [Nymphaea thermarum]|nr:putative AMP deaminase [Nymphaea thermarum]
MMMAEYRISIYGRKKSEWDQLASWIVNYELYSENVVWLIQVRNKTIECVCHGPTPSDRVAQQTLASMPQAFALFKWAQFT